MSKTKKRRDKHPSTGCENKQPFVRVKLHTPECAPVHKHIDATFELKRDTDYELWSSVVAKLLAAMGYNHAAFVTGFFLDAMNGLPKEYRQILVDGIVKGLGLLVEEEAPTEENPEGSVYVKLVPRYESLLEERETESGLVVPGHAGVDVKSPSIDEPEVAKLALPGRDF